jgi:hypothetical protein
MLTHAHRQAAIVRGAALRGLAGISPRKKRCRRHYGCIVMYGFREGIDPEGDIYHEPYSNQKLCRNRILWLISKVSSGFQGFNTF